jgi:two-component system phosphate regulon response regulator PhoB
VAGAEDALEYLRDGLCDIVVSDVMMLGMQGDELCRRIKDDARLAWLPVILLTAKSGRDFMIEGLAQGADDYITKPFSPKELVARIRAVLRRRSPELAGDIVTVAGLKLDPHAHRVTGHDQELSLGPTEFRVLNFLMTHTDRVFSRTQLLDYIWGDHVFLEERTIDVHIRRLRQALEPTGHHLLIETIRGSGYRFSSKLPTGK